MLNRQDICYSKIRNRLSRDWLVGVSAAQVLQAFEQRWESLVEELSVSEKSVSEKPVSEKLPRILLAEADPVRFLGGFFAAVAAGCPLFLGNPAWSNPEWNQVLAQVQPSRVWSSELLIQDELHHSYDSLQSLAGTIMIPTGGTSGQVRFVMHTWETLMASVAGFCDYFEVGAESNSGLLTVNAYCVLPLYHVSGLMQVLRCFASGGILAIAPFKSLKQGHTLPLPPETSFFSLVPTQLQRLMRSPSMRDWLAQFHAVLLGGAPAWMELLQEARSHAMPLAPTYGMTETASQIATLKPSQFLAQEPSQGWVGNLLPHAQVTIRDAQGNVLEPHQVGAIAIQGRSLGLGYFGSHPNNQDPAINPWQVYHPDDLGYLDDARQLHIVGRNSDKIISGGENIFPAEVESAIRATGLVHDVAVLGLTDSVWGEAVTAVYVPIDPACDRDEIVAALGDRLSRYKRPKFWIVVDKLPRNAQGKLNRVMLREVAIDPTTSTVLSRSTPAQESV
ncbi:MAG: 2-succinylbenzoate--CoA ligase [Elainellaceae cyanobacterium]